MTTTPNVWAWWKPKALNSDVTNLEVWLLLGAGFVVGRLNGRLLGWGLLGAGIAVSFFITWWRGHCGLDQWPNGHGRYYKRWLGLPEGHGDYYAWLAREMGNRDPWADWARREQELR